MSSFSQAQGAVQAVPGADFGQFQRRCYEIAASKGFHAKDGAAGSELEGLQFQRRLMLIVGEVAEAHDAHHRGAGINVVSREVRPDGRLKPEGVPIELADIVIRVADLCESYGIDLGAAIQEKLSYNEGREFMHGKTF